MAAASIALRFRQERHLTFSLTGRAPRSTQRRKRIITKRLRRIAVTYHGPLQRLLDKLAVDVFSMSDLKDRHLFPPIVNEIDDAVIPLS
jgi:hypothetical protein